MSTLRQMQILNNKDILSTYVITLPSSSCMHIIYWSIMLVVCEFTDLIGKRYDVKQWRLSYRHVHLFHGNHTTAVDMEWRTKVESCDKHDKFYCFKKRFSYLIRRDRNGWELASLTHLVSLLRRGSNVPYKKAAMPVECRRKVKRCHLSGNPATALISFKHSLGFSSFSLCGKESYLVMSQNLKLNFRAKNLSSHYHTQSSR